MNFRKAQVIWQHRLWGNGDASSEFSNGIYFHGDKASLFVQDSKVVIFPSGKDNNREDMDIPTLQMQEDHVANFLQAVRNKDKGLITCYPEDAFKSTATVQLAMIAYNSGSIVKWDQNKSKIIADP
jgi:hypothetical protein